MEVCNKKILIVDDEHNVRQILKTYLLVQGYEVTLALNGKEALKIFVEKQPDLVVLDVMVSKIDGYSVCNQLRQRSNVPIILLSALSNISDRILGLELGADDYMIKPFSPKELEVRIRSILRQLKHNFKFDVKKSSNVAHIGKLKMDLDKRQVFKAKTWVKLTEIEFNLLKLLISNAGEELSRTYILDSIWGYTPERYIDTRIVDVHISRLRYKLEKNPTNPDLILTTRGVGYMFQKSFIKNKEF